MERVQCLLPGPARFLECPEPLPRSSLAAHPRTQTTDIHADRFAQHKGIEEYQTITIYLLRTVYG